MAVTKSQEFKIKVSVVRGDNADLKKLEQDLEAFISSVSSAFKIAEKAREQFKELDANRALQAQEKSVRELQNSMMGLSDSVSSVSQLKVVDQATAAVDQATVARLHNTLDSLDKSLHRIATKGVQLGDVQTVQIMNAQINNLDSSLNRAATGYERLNKSAANNVVVVRQQVTILSVLGSAFSSLFGAVSFTLRLFDSLVKVLTLLTTGSMLTGIKNLLILLAAFLSIRGYQAAGRAIRELEKNFEHFVGVFQGATGDLLERFEQLAARARLYFDIMDALKTAAWVGGFAALGSALVIVGSRIPSVTAAAGALAIGMRNVMTAMMGKADVMRKRVAPGYFAMQKASLILGAALTGLGIHLVQSEEKLEKLAGGMLIVAGVIVGAWGAAIAVLLRSLRGLGETLSDKISTALDKFIMKAKEFEVAMSSFSFTIESFGRELGEAAVGTANYWMDQMDRMRESTIFTKTEMAQAIQILIAENQALGLNVSELGTLFQRSSDLASSFGKGLVQTTLAMAKGLLGNTMMLQEMGIAINDTALNASLLVAETGRATNQLTELEKAQTRYTLLLQKTNPFLGAAVAHTRTLAGAQAIHARSVEELNIALGGSSRFMVMVLELKTAMIDSVLGLSDGFFMLASDALDFLSVGFRVMAWMATNIGLISALTIAYNALNVAIIRVEFIQNVLNRTFQALPASIAATMVPVKNLANVFTNLRTLVTGVGLVSGFKLLGQVISGIGATLGKLAVIVGPFILKLLAIGAVVAAIVKVFIELGKNTEVFGAIFSGVSAVFSYFVDLAKRVMFSMGLIKDGTAEAEENFNQLIFTVNRVIGVVTSFVKFIIAGVTNFFLTLERVVLGAVNMVLGGVKSLLSSFGALSKGVSDVLNKVLSVLSSRLSSNSRNLKEMSALALDSSRDLLSLGQNTAIAALNTDKLRNSMEGLRYGATSTEEQLKRLIDAYNQGFDPAQERIRALGTEFEKLALKQLEAQVEVIRAENLNAKVAEKAKAIAEARQDLLKTNLELERARISLIAAFGEEEERLTIDRLRQSGDLIAAVNMEYDARVRAFEAQIEGLLQIGALNDEQITQVARLRQALDDARAAALARAMEDSMREATRLQTRELDRMREASRRVQDELDKQGSTQLQLIGLERKRALERASNLEKELEAAGKLGPEQAAIIAGYREMADMQAKLAKQSMALGDFALGDIFGDPGGTARDMAAMFGRIPEAFMDKLKKTTLSDVVQAIEDSIVMSFQFVDGLLSGKFVDAFAEQIDRFGNMPQAFVEAFSNLNKIITNLIQSLPQMLQRFIEQFPSMVEKFVEAFPKLIQSFVAAMPRIVKAIADNMGVIVEAILDGLIALVEKLPDILGPLIEKLPEIFAKILQKLPELITAIFQALPEIFAQLIEIVPDLVVSLAENIGPIVEALIEGLIGGIGKIVAALIDTLITQGGIVKIAVALTKALLIDLPVALARGVVNGIIEALKAIGGALFGGIRMPASITEFPKQIEETFQKIGKNLSRESAQLFQVKDLEEGLKGIDIADKIGNAILSATTEAEKRMRGVWAKLVEAWRHIWDTIFAPFFNFLRDIWLMVWDNILGPFVNLLKDVWMFVWDKVLSPLINGIGQFAEMIIGMGKKIWDGVVQAGSQVLGFFANLGKTIWDGLYNGIKTLPNFFRDMLNNLNPASLLRKIFGEAPGMWGRGKVENALGIDVPFAKFNQGGIVPGQASVAGDSLINDRILALLSPGETIIPRSISMDPTMQPYIQALLDGSIDELLAYFKISAPKVSAPSLPSASQIVGGIGEALGNVVAPVQQIAKDPFKGISELGEAAIENLKKLDPKKLWDMVEDRLYGNLMKLFEANSFHTGGLVTEGPAMLEPGEFVVNRRATQRHAPLLSAINSGDGLAGFGGGGGVHIENININAKTMLTPEQIRREVIPAIEKDLRRKSLDGKQMIASGAVFTR